jgi:hypothetical protein
MTEQKDQKTPEEWWSTAIIEMRPGVIRYRGYAIEELIGRVGFAEMVWLLTRGELPDPNVAKLLEAALVAAVDHGPQAPSIAVARMAMTCGLGINNAMASAINLLGDVHGGAGEQCVALFNAIGSRVDSAGVKPGDLDAIRSAAEAAGTCRSSRGGQRYFGPLCCHRSHGRNHPGRAEGSKDPDEHRWGHGSDLCGARLPAAALPWTFCPFAFCRSFGSCVGGIAIRKS